MKKVVFAGNMIVDALKRVSSLPKRGMLAKIVKEEGFAVGGSACNTPIDLKVIDPSIAISVRGRIGDDEKGKFILKNFSEYGIEASSVVVDRSISTSYTDVLTEEDGSRTFLNFGGASDELTIEDIDIANLDCDLFHIGYLLLLKNLDGKDEEYGTKMARLLCQIQEKGIKTSIDVVSDSGDRYRQIVLPALPYCDYVVINEIEIGSIAGIPSRDEEGRLIEENVRRSIEALFRYGVKDTVIVHCPEFAILKRKDRDFFVVPSFRVPKEKIISTVGAGDAFLAGAIYGLLQGYPEEDILKIAHASAANNLFAKDSISGAKPLQIIRKYLDNPENQPH